MFLARLLSAQGRVSRWSWWVVAVIYFGITGEETRRAASDMPSNMREHSTGTYIMLAVMGFLIFWVYIAAGIKRFHDLGRSGWWMLIATIPLVAIIWLGLVPGQRGTNRYGEPNLGSPFDRRSEPVRDKVTAP